ncbi:molybdate ABC transporter substrate-binding protein [Serpentinicella alkaliphila]|uniref:Molybdate transport system substrate-binding protein n=1 Tax=Serpentinicella alkaliphila TaxID=1734049 RepID=A0A4V2T433_9FIRM|nr:molybdate ABC transporter substrate-binding protein [Serpentinicella alkaliphila]QUH24743.1 molybdate ABC transporter substrate-binding protein [Serpentinicella alkaliphila]TCQ03734.1 molybdate transport system substrate-binding protein [Serpentinicella alkaliphila]
MHKKILKIIIGMLVLGIVLTGCSNKKVENIHKEDLELHVAAASNFKFAFEKIGELFEQEFGCKVIFQFGSTGNLTQQIINGAPIDVFAPASENFIDELIDRGDILEETKDLYAIGRIVLVTNEKLNVKVESLEDLKLDEITSIAIANPNHAPYGLAAKEALISFGLWDLIEHKVVYSENVSQALQFVETGNAQVGITALSLITEDMNYLLIDKQLHNPLNQIIGIVSHSNNQQLGKAFTDFVKSPKAEVVLKEYGYDIP